MSSIKKMEKIFTPALKRGLSIQTYEYFTSDAASNLKQLDAFISGKIDVFQRSYMKLLENKSLTQLTQFAADFQDCSSNLNADSDGISEEDLSVIQSSLSYRMQEVAFVKATRQLHSFVSDPVLNEKLITQYIELNTSLYGEPSERVYDQIRGEVWHVINCKTIHPSLQSLRLELKNGINLPKSRRNICFEQSTSRLPVLSKNAARWTSELLHNDFAYFYELANNYWNSTIVPRSKQNGKPLEFTNDDMYVLFSDALGYMDPDGTSGVQVSRMQDFTMLAWDSATASVQVGTGERKTPIDSPMKGFAKLLHELVAYHGNRSIFGARTGMPLLGIGVFSAASGTENPDYLTFEEGIASLTEAILAGETSDTENQWSMERLRLYMMISLGHLRQYTSREIYEIVWRCAVLMKSVDNSPMPEAEIYGQKREAALALERYERGVPSELLQNSIRFGFHKDLSYLNGRLKAMAVIEDLSSRNDIESFRNMLCTKTDPTNVYQSELAARYGYKVRLTGVNSVK